MSREDGVLQGETICLERKPGMEEICDLSPCHHSVPQVERALERECSRLFMNVNRWFYVEGKREGGGNMKTDLKKKQK